MHKLKVFVVEDELWVRRGILFRLSRLEDFVDIAGEAATFEEALPAMLALDLLDVLLTDIVLPERTGLELIQEIKRHRPSLLVYIISGYSEFAYAQRAIDLGVNGYLLKPIQPGALEKALIGLQPRHQAVGLDEAALASLCALSDLPNRAHLDALLRRALAPTLRKFDDKALLSQSSSQIIDAVSHLLERIGVPFASESMVRDGSMKAIAYYTSSDSWLAFFTNLLENEVEQSSKSSTAQNGRLIHAVQQFIRLHYADELSLDSLARRFGISSAHLSRCFKTAAGEGLSEFIARTRVGVACALLRESSLPTAQIAEKLCFTDVSYFTKVFRRFTGETPAAYRRREEGGAPPLARLD